MKKILLIPIVCAIVIFTGCPPSSETPEPTTTAYTLAGEIYMYNHCSESAPDTKAADVNVYTSWRW